MERWVLQQTFPNWDSLRIMNSRGDHLEWMHRHFATKVVTGSDLLAEVDAEDDRTHDRTAAGRRGRPARRRSATPRSSSGR